LSGNFDLRIEEFNAVDDVQTAAVFCVLPKQIAAVVAQLSILKPASE